MSKQDDAYGQSGGEMRAAGDEDEESGLKNEDTWLNYLKEDGGEPEESGKSGPRSFA